MWRRGLVSIIRRNLNATPAGTKTLRRIGGGQQTRQLLVPFLYDGITISTRSVTRRGFKSRIFDTSAKRAMTLPGQLESSCRRYLCSREVGRPLTASELLFERLGAECEFWNDGLWNDGLPASPRRCRRIYEWGAASRVESSRWHDSFVCRVQSV